MSGVETGPADFFSVTDTPPSGGEVSYTTYNSWVIARFAGDAQYAPDSFIWTVKVKSRVNTTLAGHYPTKKVGSLPYRIRAEYRPTSRDIVNDDTVGAWKHFTYTK